MLIRNSFSEFTKKVFDVSIDNIADRLVHFKMFGATFYDASNLVYKTPSAHNTISDKNVRQYSLTSVFKSFIADIFGLELKTKKMGNTSALIVRNRSLAAAIISALITLPITLFAIIIGTPPLILKYLAKIALLKIFPNKQYLPISVAIAASMIFLPFNVIYALANLAPSLIRAFIQVFVVNVAYSAYHSLVKGRNDYKIEEYNLTTSFNEYGLSTKTKNQAAEQGDESKEATVLEKRRSVSSNNTSFESNEQLEESLGEITGKVTEISKLEPTQPQNSSIGSLPKSTK